MRLATHDLPAEEPVRFGPYLAERLAFRGSFCDVYRCRDAVIDRTVALKVARRDLTARVASRKLWHEARIRAVLDHPHVLPLYRAGRSRGGSYLAGPWIDGGSLADRARRPQPPTLLVAVAEGIGSALDALHAAGWLHVDLSAGNVLLHGDGRAILADFAAAHPLGTPLLRQRHPAAEITPQVLSPEAWEGEPLDARSDLYALGALLYRVATGRYPFEGRRWQDFPEQHRLRPVPPPSRLSTAVGPHVEAVLLRALAKRRQARFEHGSELAANLRRALDADGTVDGAFASERSRALGASVSVPRREPAAAPMDETFTGEAVVRAGERLEHFAAGLDEREQLALRELLTRGREAETSAVTDVASLTTQLFAVPAAMLALEETGAAEALARGPATAEELTTGLAIDPVRVTRLLEVLGAAGALGVDDGRYELPPPLAVVYRSTRQGGRAALPIRTGAELWSHLPSWARGAGPYVQMDRADGSGYSPVVGLLGGLFEGRARALATELRQQGLVPPGAAILDVGAGSGVWSAALAQGDPTLTVTAVDREPVLQITVAHAEAAGHGARLRTLAGDWREVVLPEQSFDLALLANLCHLEAEEDAATLVQRTAAALQPTGALVIVDTVPEVRASAPLVTLLHGLRLSLRSAGGLHDRVSYKRWLSQAGLRETALLPLDRRAPGLSALIARRPTTAPDR